MKTTDLKLQRQIVSGAWVPCVSPDGVDLTEIYLARCEQNNSVDTSGKIVPRHRGTRNLTREEVLAALTAGLVLRNDVGDWYSQCRSEAAHEQQVINARANKSPAIMVRCACGHTIDSRSVMSASLGTSCAACYDRMSS